MTFHPLTFHRHTGGAAAQFNSAPPLSLYVHLPWCVRRCPYCDFNAHAASGPLPEADYLNALLRDVEADLPRVWGRPVATVFLGGGTPSLFSPQSIAELLSELRARLTLLPGAEITMEANPGTLDTARLQGFHEAGVNRLSLGVQSFQDPQLKALGRIHDVAAARRAIEVALASGFGRVNIDLMFGLPGQDVALALADLDAALEYDTGHLSWYQLTLEPNTVFHSQPPVLPDADLMEDIYEAGLERLAAAGYRRYEVSAYARPGDECQHNLNYWQFGDYLGIGAGAHGKLTLPEGILRLAKYRQPQTYMTRASAGDAVTDQRWLSADERAFEFLLNALRLCAGFTWAQFRERTGLPLTAVRPRLDQAAQRGLVTLGSEGARATSRGFDLLDSILEDFLPVATPA
ncbi:radical SAM family heme chaperone HemW [Immundisolibacter sp.]|uniref:radical SAM family heme chaperone HemW n=1 Tax=Immundisolibacter sp. TaxID=1934948 RepID=UPI003565421A